MLLVDGRPESDRQMWDIVRQGLRLWSRPMWPFHPSPHLLADADVFHLEHRLLNARRTRQPQVLTSSVSKTQNLHARWQGLRSRRCGGRAEALTGRANRKHDVSARGCMCSTSRTSSWSVGSRHISAPNCFRSGKRAAAEDFAIFVIRAMVSNQTKLGVGMIVPKLCCCGLELGCIVSEPFHRRNHAGPMHVFRWASWPFGEHARSRWSKAKLGIWHVCIELRRVSRTLGL